MCLVCGRENDTICPSAAASECPEEVGVLVSVGGCECTVGEDDCEFEDVVDA